MKQLTRFLSKHLVKDPHLWIAFLLVILLLIMEILHVELPKSWHLDFEKVTSYVIIILMTVIVIDKIKDSGIEDESHEKISSIYDKVSNSLKIMHEMQSHVNNYDATIKRPSDRYLWDGFTKRYSVYNPSFRMDKIDAKSELFLFNIFCRRFSNPEFTARYIFLTKDEAGKEALHFFQELMDKVRAAMPKEIDWGHKIEVKEFSNRNATDEQEMYLGDWNEEQRAIVELKDAFIDPDHGKPNFYLVIKNKEVVKHYLINHFEKAWDNVNGAKRTSPFSS